MKRTDETRVMSVAAIRERFQVGNWNRVDLDWLCARAALQPTADEIREADFACDTAEWECARWLKNITAELRDLNQTLTLAWNALESLKADVEATVTTLEHSVT